MSDFSLRFDNASLQARFVSDLGQRSVAHSISTSGAVECSTSKWLAVNDAAHAIRDSCFRWYASWFDSASDAEWFWEQLRKSDLPFQVEHHRRIAGFVTLQQGSLQTL